jgi:hypothetical protein
MDFTKLRYRVDQIPQGKPVVMAYPDLTKWSHVFMSQGDTPIDVTPDFVMRYIILNYCPGSPFISDYPELNRRKARVLSYLNVDVDANKKLPDCYNTLVGFGYQSVVDKTVLFLRLVKSAEWSLLRAAEEKHSLLLKKMLVAQEDVQDERVLVQTIESNMRLLDEGMTKFLEGEKTRSLHEGTLQFLAEENLGIDPESYIVEFGEKKTVFEGIVP